MNETGLSNKLNVDKSPTVVLVVGVNGAGKTTTIGKLSYNLKKSGKKLSWQLEILSELQLLNN